MELRATWEVYSNLFTKKGKVPILQKRASVKAPGFELGVQAFFLRLRDEGLGCAFGFINFIPVSWLPWLFVGFVFFSLKWCIL